MLLRYICHTVERGEGHCRGASRHPIKQANSVN